MKIIIHAMMSGLLLISGSRSFDAPDGEISHECLALAEAEKILGEAARYAEGSSEKTNGILKYRCTYTALTPDRITRATGNLYVTQEHYATTEDARKVFDTILADNSVMTGLRRVNDIGNDAFVHSDEMNFVLMMARKDNRIVRMKVNRLTRNTSVEELQKSVRSVVAAWRNGK